MIKIEFYLQIAKAELGMETESAPGTKHVQEKSPV